MQRMCVCARVFNSSSFVRNITCSNDHRLRVDQIRSSLLRQPARHLAFALDVHLLLHLLPRPRRPKSKLPDVRHHLLLCLCLSLDPSEMERRNDVATNRWKKENDYFASCTDFAFVCRCCWSFWNGGLTKIRGTS